MTIQFVSLIVQDDTPSGTFQTDASGYNRLWFKPSTKEWFVDQNGWKPCPIESLPTLTIVGDFTFGGNIYAGDKKGKSGNVTLADGTKLKFHKGILYDIENP